MSNIQLAYDKIREIVPAVASLSGFFEIPFPESVANNNWNILKQGWGVVVGGSNQAASQEFCHAIDETVISVIITKAGFTSRADHEEASKINRDLLGISGDVRKAMTDSQELTIPDSVVIVDYVETSAIEFVQAESGFIRTITINFSIRTREELP